MDKEKKAMASLSLKGIGKRYPNGFEAVKDFNLEIEDKEFIIFVGPSGCGKSTTLRMIAGLEEITTGDLFIDGKRMNEVEPKDRDIAMVFQNYALYPHMTVFDNMAFGLKLRKVPKEEIEQKVMDEPLSNLDAKLRVQMRAEIASLHQRLGATIIYVTHDQTEAMTLGTRIVVLKDGVIQQVDTPKKLYNEPQNLFVAGFIGSPQMNFIDAVCKVHGEEVRLEFGDFSIVLPPQKAKKLIDGGYADKTVVMGIRPDDIDDSQIQIETYGDTVIEADVTGYELLGSEVLLYYTVAGVNMTARVDARTTAKIGDHIRLALDPEKIHVFDKESELTITN